MRNESGEENEFPEGLVKESQSVREQSSGGEGGLGSCETEVKVKDVSPKMSALGVCTRSLSLYHAYKVFSKYLLNQIQFLPSLPFY